MGTLDFGVLFILGVGAFGGILGASLFQHFRIPQVVGYIAIGLLIGRSGLGIVGPEDIVALGLFNLFALGLIGFMVGGELRLGTLQRYRKQFVSILLGEGLGAFFLTGLLTGAAVWFLTRDGAISLAAGIVFGAIASATDPASTIDVLWEYRARGALTTTLIAIVALDDALAMTLYGLGTSTAGLLTGGTLSLGEVVLKIGVDLLGAILLGFLLGWLLNFIFRWMRQKEKTLGTALGAILLAIGIAVAAEMDIILATMALGVTLTNLAPRRSKELFTLAQSFSSPIYVVFFVLVGARLDIGEMPLWLWGVVGLYVVGRSLGKIFGAGWGARIMRAPPEVQRYSGMGLFAQGGVAVGLSIMATHHLGRMTVGDSGVLLGDAIIFAVTATTLIMQLTGPPMVKLGLVLAGEVGRNVTDQDVIRQLRVRDVMRADTLVLPESQPIVDALTRVAESDALAYPVVDEENRLVGTLSMNGLKSVFVDRDTWRWLIVSDVLEPVPGTVGPDEPLEEVLLSMEQTHADQLPVVDPASGRIAGLLDRHHIRKVVSTEVIRRQHAQET